MEGLEFSSGPLAGQRIEVEREVVAGREGELKLDDVEVSRRHASLRPAAGGIEVEDLGSTNGTYVNGIRVGGATIAPVGSIVKLGTSEAAVFAVPEADPNATRVAGSVPPDLTAPGRPVPEPPAAPPQSAPEPASPAPAAPAPAAPAPAPAAQIPAPGPQVPTREVATRLLLPEILTFATIGLVAVALVIYFAAR